MNFDDVRGLVASRFGSGGIDCPYFYRKARRVDSPRPYVVGSRVSETPETYFLGGRVFERVIFQLTVFSDSESAAQANEIAERIRDAFDDCDLSENVHSSWHSTLSELDDDGPNGGTVLPVRLLITFLRG